MTSRKKRENLSFNAFIINWDTCIQIATYLEGIVVNSILVLNLFRPWNGMYWHSSHFVVPFWKRHGAKAKN